MELHDVSYELDGRVAVVTLRRARYRNAQSWRLLDELNLALKHAVDDPEAKVVVVRGDGDHFSTGHDLGTPEQLADAAERSISENGLDYYDNFRKYNLDLTLAWRNLAKPTIAMVHGYCIYGGWMIAAAMDVVFAADDAQFLAGQVEYFSIPWDIGWRKSKELLFESRFISAAEAERYGLVNRVLPRADLDRETMAYAHRVSENSSLALRMAKTAVNRMQDTAGFSAAMESAFHDYLVMAKLRGVGRVEGMRRLGGVDLAVRGQRGERAGQGSSVSDPEGR